MAKSKPAIVEVGSGKRPEKSDNLEKVVINAPNYGELNGVTIYLTSDLYKKLETEKTKRDNTPILKLLEMGRAVPGMKHLITIFKATNDKGRLIFHLDKTKKDGNDYYINFDEYRKTGQSRFFSFYRETGLDTANYFLNRYYPEEFKYDSNELKTTEINKVEKQLPKVLDSVGEKEKNQVVLLQETTKVLKSKLRRKSKALKNELRELRQETNLSFYQTSLEDLNQRLASGKNYSETTGKNSWQTWVHTNNWLFGVNYLRPIPKQKVGFDNIPDYLFPTRDGFLDILEIKKPKPNVIKKDEHHTGSYVWCPDTNAAIGQVVKYIQELEDHRLEIRDRINERYGSEYGITFYVIRPRAFILVGESKGWSTKEVEAFRRLNYSLHGIEVITYSDLINRGESIIKMLTS